MINMAPVNERSSKTKKENAAQQQRALAAREKVLKVKRSVLAIVEAMIEKEVSKEWFLEKCTKLCHADYDDVVQERSIEHLCGYPLCSNTVRQTLKQKYHISQVTNKVYDLTERKYFCSNQCYKASNYLKKQLSSIPLYMRKEENIKVNLLSDCNNSGSAGEEIIFHHIISQNEIEKVYREEKDPNHYTNLLNEEIKKCANSLSGLKIKEHVFDKQYVFEDQAEKKEKDSVCKNQSELSSNSELDSDDSEVEKFFPNYENETVLSDKHMPVPKSIKKSLLISPLSSNTTINTPVELSLDFISGVFKDWMTEDTLKYLLGEKYVYGVKAENLFERMMTNDKISAEKLSSIKNEYIKLCVKIDNLPDSDVSESSDLDFIPKEIDNSAAKKKDVNSSAKNIYKKRPKRKSNKKNKCSTSTLNTEVTNEKKKSSPIKEECNSVTDNKAASEESVYGSSVPEPMFPLVDSVSQNVLRRQVVVSKLKPVYVDLLPIIGLHYTDIREGIKKFVDTLSLTPSNIIFKPKEWKLISLILLRILTRTILKYIHDEAMFLKLCENHTMPVRMNVEEIEKLVSDIISPESIVSIK